MHRSTSLTLGCLLFVAASLARVQGAESKSDAITVSGECRVSNADARWIDASVTAWMTIRRELIPSQAVPETTAVFFDANCIYRADSLRVGQRSLHLTATRHAGQIKLPSGADFPAQVTAFAAPIGEDSVFFIMSLPSLWVATEKKFPFDSQTFLTAVMIHEISHVVQFRTYLKQSAAVEGIERLGKTVNDDVVQNLFADNESFSASVDEEMQLLFSAAAASSIEECRELTKRALAMMRSRQATYYVDRLHALAQLEDIFLTMEGSGQFAALTWLTHPEGGGLSSSLARRGFGEGERFWSQRQGVALFLVLDRLARDWRQIVYGDGRRTVLQLLDEALNSPVH
jgi:hypothetical protein